MKRILKLVLVNVFFGGLGFFFGKRSMGRRIGEGEEQLGKQLEFYKLLVAWVEIKQKGKSLVEYFSRRSYKTVAIYGMKELGERLFEELENTDVQVKYTIDKNLAEMYKNTKYKTVASSDSLEAGDVIVVTATHYFATIYAELARNTDAEIVSLEDVIYEIV